MKVVKVGSDKSQTSSLLNPLPDSLVRIETASGFATNAGITLRYSRSYLFIHVCFKVSDYKSVVTIRDLYDSVINCNSNII